MRFLSFLLLLALAGCNPGSLMNRMAPPSADSAARGMVAAIVKADTARFYAALDSTITTENALEGLGRIQTLLGGQRPGPLEQVEWGVMAFRRVRYDQFVYQAPLGRRWLVAGVNLQRRESGPYLVTGFTVNVLKVPPAVTNGFWRNLTAAKLLWWLPMLLAVLTTLYAAVRAARSKARRRWLLVLIALVGIGQFTMNWTTGGLSLKLVRFQLFGAGFLRTPLGPWMLSWSIPLGALWVLWRLHRQSAAPAIPPAEAPVPVPEPESTPEPVAGGEPT